MSGGSDKVDRLNTLVELVRLSSTARKGGTRKPPSPQNRPHDGASEATNHHDISELRNRLTTQLLDHAGRDPVLSTEQASRMIVREILLWEFGAQLELHSEFSAMLGNIERTFDSNPTLKTKMTSLVEDLKRNSD